MARQKRDLTRDEIVDVATRMLAQEGEATLSMRRLAEACGVTPMAIYHHVANKAELIDLVMDHIILSALDDLGPRPEAWRTALVDTVAAFRDAFIDNPGAGRIFVSRAVVGVGTARVTEEMMRYLSRGGLEGRRLAEATDAMTLVVLGSIVNELTRPPKIRTQLMEQLPADETPRLAENIEVYAHRDPRERFLKTLEWLLDGVERTPG